MHLIEAVRLLRDWLTNKGVYSDADESSHGRYLFVRTPPNYNSRWIATVFISNDLEGLVWGPGSNARFNFADPTSFDVVFKSIVEWRKLDFKYLTLVWKYYYRHNFTGSIDPFSTYDEWISLDKLIRQGELK